jgi:hypothetical protein
MILSLSLWWCFLTGEGLRPLEPPRGTTIQSELRTAPDEKALILRQVVPSDRIRYLRSQIDWYEIELTSQEGFVFRGWVKGSLPDERKPPPSPVEVQRPPAPNPIEPSKYLWFFSSKIAEKLSLDLGLGVQNLSYQLKGTYTDGQKKGSRGSIYSFSAPGFALHVHGSLPVVEFSLTEHRASVILDGQFSYGLSNVSFNSDFQVSELRGSSFEVASHQYDIKALMKYELTRRPSTYNLAVSLGAGYLLYDVLPDLNPIHGGSFDGEIVVGDITFSGVGFPIQFDVRAFRHFSAKFSMTPYLLLGDVSEEITSNTGYEISTLSPIQIEFSGAYQIASAWSAVIEGRYLKFEGSGSGNGARLKSNYQNGELFFQSYQILAGLKFDF